VASKVVSSRDPARPKRPISAWLRYLADFRKQNVALKGPEVMKDASAKWKALTTEQRKPYEIPYQAEKKVYDKAFAEYVSSGKRDAWVRDPEKPKRPKTGFIRFATEYRTKNPALKMTEASKKAGEVWKTMSAESKAPYEKLYTTEKAQYDKLMQAYKDSGKEEAWKANKPPTPAEKKKAKQEEAKAKEAAKKAKAKEKEAAKKAKEAAKKAKDKEKEAAKKLKAKEAADKAKAKAVAAAAKLKEKKVAAKQKEAATKEKEAAKLAQVQQGKGVAQSRATA